MAVALHHSSLYQPLVAEEYKLKFNKAVKGKEVHDLDVRNDEFWQKNLNRIFPEVADDLKQFISDWKKEYESISMRQMTDDMQEFTESICSALDLVPEMNDKRKRNESHTKILGTLVNAISGRKLDEFNSVELTILQGGKLKGEDLETFETLICIDSKNNQELTYDKIRLFIIYIFGYMKLEVKRCTEVFQKICKSSEMEEGQRLVLEDMMKARLEDEDVNKGNHNLLNRFALKSLSLVKNLIRGEKGSKIEGIVNKVLKRDMNIEGFKHVRLFQGEEIMVSDLKFKNIVVYCIDNGSYIEYDSISKLGESINENVFYGAGSLSSPSEILDHLFES